MGFASLTAILQTTARKASAGASRHATSAHSQHLLRWLASFGGLGVFGVAIVDSSIIPLPLPGSTDLLLLLLTSHRGTTAIAAAWLAACAVCGSIIGGYLCWSTGRKGGEVALERYIPARFLKRITGWVERHGVWSVALAAILPPPVPLTPFVLAAGALNVPRRQFLLSFGMARLIRYSLLAWLGVTYGRRIVRTWQTSLGNWSSTILWIYGGLVALAILFGLWKFLKARRAHPQVPVPEPDVA